VRVEKVPGDAKTQDHIIVALPWIQDQESEVDAMSSPGLNLQNSSIDTTECSKINANKPTAGNSMTSQAHISASMQITRYLSADIKETLFIKLYSDYYDSFEGIVFYKI
jgi:hypothetical protein